MTRKRSSRSAALMRWLTIRSLRLRGFDGAVPDQRSDADARGERSEREARGERLDAVTRGERSEPEARGVRSDAATRGRPKREARREPVRTRQAAAAPRVDRSVGPRESEAPSRVARSVGPWEAAQAARSVRPRRAAAPPRLAGSAGSREVAGQPEVARSVGPLGQPVGPVVSGRPGSPFDDAMRGAPPCPLRVRSAPACRNLDQVLSQVREIAVWAGTDGRVQDTGLFLLMDGERTWHSVAFGDAQGAELISRMRAIPGFDTNLLLDAVSSRSGQIEPLWPPRVAAGAGR